MSEAVDSVKRRLVYIPDDEQVMLSELSGAPSHRASRMSRLLITRSPCLSEGNRTPPEPSFASTSPSLEDLPPTASLVMLSSSAANCLHKASDTKHIKQITPHKYEQNKHVNSNVYKKQQTGVVGVADDDHTQNGTTYESKEEDKMTEITEVGRTWNKRCRAHIADASLHTFTPTPLPRRGATPVVDKTKVDALLLVSYDGFLLADGSGHVRPPRTAAEARKIIHALEQCKVYLTECASSASLSSLFKAVDVPTIAVRSEKTSLPTSVPSPEQKEDQLQELKQEQKEQEELEQEKEETENECSGASEENDSWNDDEFSNLSSSSATSSSLLSEASSSSSEKESLSDNTNSEEEEEEEEESKFSHSSRSNSGSPTKKQKTQNISQQQQRKEIKKEKLDQAKRVGNTTSIKQRALDKISSCNSAKTSDKSKKRQVAHLVKTQQCVNNNNNTKDEFDFDKLPTMTAKALREMLGQHGLSTNGSKCVLRSRLKRYLKRKQTLKEKEVQEENEHVEQLESARNSTMKTNASRRNYRRSSRSSKSRSRSVESLKKSDESTPDLSISFSTSTDDHNSNRTSSIISRRSTCLPELTTSTQTAISNTATNTTTSTRNSVPLILPSSVNTTPTQSTRLELLRSSYTAPSKPNGGFWSTLMTAGSRLFSRSSNLADNCNSKVHSQEMGRAESLPSYKRRRSAE